MARRPGITRPLPGALLLAAALLLAGCGSPAESPRPSPSATGPSTPGPPSGGTPAPPPPPPARSNPFPLPLIATKWVLLSLNGRTGPDRDAPRDDYYGAHLTIAGNHTVDGSTPCGSFTARAEITPPAARKITFTDLKDTPSQNCSGSASEMPELPGLHQEMLKALRTPALSYRIDYDKGVLGLYAPNAPKTPLLEAVPAHAFFLRPNEIDGMKWFTDPGDHAPETAPFFWLEGGTVRGFNGCQRFAGGAAVSVGRPDIRFFDVRALPPDQCTNKPGHDAAGPDAKAARAAELMKRLDGPYQFKKDFRTIEFTRQGAPAFSANSPGRPATTPVPDGPSSGPDRLTGAWWNIPRIDAVSGDYTDPPGPGAGLRIDADGHVRGHSGCDEFAARAQVEKGTVRISDVVEVTDRTFICPEIQQHGSRDLLQRLSKGFTYAKPHTSQDQKNWETKPLGEQWGFPLEKP
ncbi:hypothetical protein SSPIM334S_04724 [Streptomyces spiroverticillatus]|nr:META domain-containing protein [Streptomyces finlayi]